MFADGHFKCIFLVSEYYEEYRGGICIKSRPTTTVDADAALTEIYFFKSSYDTMISYSDFGIELLINKCLGVCENNTM